MGFRRDMVVAGSMVGGFCVYLFLTVSCIAPKPLPVIYPPGWTPPSVKQTQAPVAKVARSAFVAPLPTVTLTCDFGDGPRDGEHIYVGKRVGQFSSMLTFPPTNQFEVPCDTNTPSFIELRSFVNWPSPYIVQTWTNDDGSTFNTTNFWREGPINGYPVVADFVFVPTGCQSIGLLNYGSNMVVTGWGVGGKVYQILSAPTLDTPSANWQTNGTVTGTNGPYQVPVMPVLDQVFYRTVTQ